MYTLTFCTMYEGHEGLRHDWVKDTQELFSEFLQLAAKHKINDTGIKIKPGVQKTKQQVRKIFEKKQ